jgi:hypothetical protein
VRYDVQVQDDGRFEHEQPEPLTVDGFITVAGSSYRVVSMRPDESGDFDAMVEVRRVAGPGQVE